MTKRLTSSVILCLLAWAMVACGRAADTPAPEPLPIATVASQSSAATAPRPTSKPTPSAVYDVPLPPVTSTAITVLTAAVGQSSPQASETGRSGEETRVTILHTNDSRGYVDPCG